MLEIRKSFDRQLSSWANSNPLSLLSYYSQLKRHLQKPGMYVGATKDAKTNGCICVCCPVWQDVKRHCKQFCSFPIQALQHISQAWLFSKQLENLFSSSSSQNWNHKASSYGPISLLYPCIASKLLEWHVHQYITVFLSGTNPLSTRQWGFQFGRSIVNHCFTDCYSWVV